MVSVLLMVLIVGVPGTGHAGDNTPGSVSPFYLTAGVGAAYIGESINAHSQNATYELKVDSDVYPVLRAGWAFTDNLALGVDLALGVVRGNLDLRLGYRYFELDGGDRQDGVVSADDTLNLSGVYVEIAWRFGFGE